MAVTPGRQDRNVGAEVGGGAVSSEDRICASCGHKNRRHHAFCRSCGVRLEAAGAGPTEDQDGGAGERLKAEESGGVSGERSKAAGGGVRPWLVGLGVLLIVVPFLTLAVLFTVRIVDEGEVGVVHMFGEVDPEPRPPGLHFKLPRASMSKMDVETQQLTLSSDADEDAGLTGETVEALTYEGLTIGVDVTVRFRLEAARAPAVFREIGPDYVEVILLPAIRRAIRDVLAGFPLEDFCGLPRATLEDLFQSEFEGDLRNRGLMAEGVQVLKVFLPIRIRQAIEQKFENEQRHVERLAEMEARSREARGDTEGLPPEKPIPVPVDPFAPSDELILGCWR